MAEVERHSRLDDGDSDCESVETTTQSFMEAVIGDEQVYQTPPLTSDAPDAGADASDPSETVERARNTRQRHSTATVLLGLLTCAICGGTLEHARTVPCGNSLCDDCWDKTELVGGMRVCPFKCIKGRHWNNTGHDVVLTKLWSLLREEYGRISKGEDASVEQPSRLRSDRSTEFIRLLAVLLEHRSVQAAEELDESDRTVLSDAEKYSAPARSSFRIADILDGLKEVPTLANHAFELPSDTTSIPSTILPSVLAELDCQICYSSLYDPLTTPCGHTFCRTCLLRSVDHTPTCPTCRSAIPPPFANLYHAPRSGVVTSLMLNFWPLLWAERKNDIEATETSPQALFGAADGEQLGPGLTLPIFVCSLAFPYMPTFLHIFEPRYKLMIRRCMASDRRFGMAVTKVGSRGGRANEDPQCPIAQYGTVLRINSVQYLDDGRSLIETTGEDRFKLLRWGAVDGYIMGHCELLPDDGMDGDSDEELASSLLSARELGFEVSEAVTSRTVQQLLDDASEFISELRNGSAPWMLQRLEMTHGVVPEDPSVFAFWVASVIPVRDEEKYLILKARSVKTRLLIVLHWLRKIQAQWWIAGQCTIM